MSTPTDYGGRSLPRYLTSFVGRQREIAEITGLLLRDDVRLLTLVGPGGAGKTRLAVESATRLDDNTFEGIRFVSLVAVQDSALVLPAIAQALGLQLAASRPVDEAIARFLGDRQVLLIIDNLEHVTDAAPDLGRILLACPQTMMLVTSRVALHISGEHLMLIHPLETPNSADFPLDRLCSFESVQLFLQRAGASGQNIPLTPENAAAISRIVRRLDGLPLALELAAARCSLLSPTVLATLLERGSGGVLSDGPHDAPARHRSLQDAIAWSYELLTEQEQNAFRRLAVFSGGFSLATAEAVVDLPIDMLATIASLQRQSLIVPTNTNGPDPRFTMLETLREFGLGRLEEAGDLVATRDRHASYFLQEAIDSEYAWCMFLPEGLYWLNRLVDDQSNIRSALNWLYATGDITHCLHMSGALAPLWAVCGNLDEGRTWLERLLADQRVVDDAVRANGIATLSWILNEQNQRARAFQLAEEVIDLSRTIDIPLDAIRGLVLSGRAALDLGQHDLAKQRLEASIELMSVPGMPDWISNWIQNVMVMLGYVELSFGELDAAEAWFNDAYAYDIDRGYEPGTSYILGTIVFSGLMWMARVKGDGLGALKFSQQQLRLNQNSPNVGYSIHAICDIAGALAALGQLLPAARLFGASEALNDLYGLDFVDSFDIQRAVGLPEPWARETEPCGTAERLRDALMPRTVLQLPSTMTQAALDEAWADGRHLSLAEAVTEALAATAEPAEDAAFDPVTTYRLSAREIEVLRLVAEGGSNREIAETLYISERTVEHHVAHILAKLDLDSRTAAAIFAVRNGLT